MEKKFQIFISSTYEDLKEERAKLVATILKVYHFPIGMEMFSADNVEQWEQIRRTIDSSDYYVLVIKRRYGSMTKDGISYTEKEYNYAKEKKIPVLAFVAARDAAITNSDIEDDPEKLFLLKKFTERVLVENPSEFWKNPDDLCTKVSQALHKQFETNQRRGWIKNNEVGGNDDIEKMNIQTLIDIKRKVEYEIIRKNKDIRLAYDFVDNIDDKILHSITKQTYIDNFNREIVLEIIGDQLRVGITTRIEFLNVKNDINYYSSSPRFETLEQAKSYKHEDFTINGVDYRDKIVSEIECTHENRQFPYLLRNAMPLVYDSNSITVVHKTSHKIPVNQFFHVYQLVFPCRSFLTTIIISGNQDNKYKLKTGTFSSFNVHTYEKHTSEYRKDGVNTITIGKWALPGSGYTVTLQKDIPEGKTEKSLMHSARMGVFFDDSVFVLKPEDLIKYRAANEEVSIDFNLNPYERSQTLYPKFLSFVLKYIDKMDLEVYLNANENAQLVVCINNVTDSLTGVSVEFKYSDLNMILQTFEFVLNKGENLLRIPLKDMYSMALSTISEICFVIHPDEIKQNQGTFQISNMRIE